MAAEAAERYPFGPFQAARKLERLCLCAMTMEEPAVAAVERYQGNLLYVARLAGLSGNLPSLAGGFGLFFEADLPRLEALAPLLPPKAQTLVCGGAGARRRRPPCWPGRGRGAWIGWCRWGRPWRWIRSGTGGI